LALLKDGLERHLELLKKSIERLLQTGV